MKDIEFLGTAIYNLTGGANYSTNPKDDGSYTIEWNDKKSEPTQTKINAEIKKLRDEYDAQAYARARKPLYPDIGDQLDDLYHKGAFSADMAAKIKKVKDDNPKG